MGKIIDDNEDVATVVVMMNMIRMTMKIMTMISRYHVES